MPQEILLGNEQEDTEINQKNLIVKKDSHLFKEYKGINYISYSLTKDIHVVIGKEDNGFYEATHVPEEVDVIFKSGGYLRKREALEGLLHKIVLERNLQHSENETGRLSKSKLQQYNYLVNIIKHEEKIPNRA